MADVNLEKEKKKGGKPEKYRRGPGLRPVKTPKKGGDGGL